MVLVLDLGWPMRVFIAMTHNNFKSIFAWNIYLYTGFVIIVAAYLFTMMDRRASKSATLGKAVGWLAFVWRLVLTTGTGSIFGFLIAREAYDSAIMAALFIAASFLYGLSFTVLVLLMMCRETRQELMTAEMRRSFQGLLIIFSLAVLFFTAVQHLTNVLFGGAPAAWNCSCCATAASIRSSSGSARSSSARSSRSASWRIRPPVKRAAWRSRPPRRCS